MASFKQNHFKCCFQNWILQQRQDLDELVDALSSNSDDAVLDSDEFARLREKSVRHFEEYAERRALMAPHDAAAFIAPPWCSSFEKAFLWVGGCRPSLAIRLVYSVSGSEFEARLDEFLRGERKGDLGDIDGVQLDMINALHLETVKEEEKLSNKLASLQEEIADEPLAMIANKAARTGEWGPELERVMVAHSISLAHIIAEADKLRLATMKELMAILTPLQAVDFLAATKKLHLSMHEWGNKRDCLFGSVTNN